MGEAAFPDQSRAVARSITARAFLPTPRLKYTLFGAAAPWLKLMLTAALCGVTITGASYGQDAPSGIERRASPRVQAALLEPGTNANVGWATTLFTLGDSNTDGCINLLDWPSFPACLLGPDSPSGQSWCQVFDFDEDTYIDLRDVASFQRAVAVGVGCVCPPVVLCDSTVQGSTWNGENNIDRYTCDGANVARFMNGWESYYTFSIPVTTTVTIDALLDDYQMSGGDLWLFVSDSCGTGAVETCHPFLEDPGNGTITLPNLPAGRYFVIIDSKTDGEGLPESPFNHWFHLTCSTCGDGSCDPLENACNCPQDCGVTACGNGLCGCDEDACNCPQDCSSVCGDGCCTGAENTSNCCQDCAVTACGDGSCGCDEDACNCPQDCGSVCGDGCCTGAENTSNCCQDCAVTACGDGSCGCDEDASNCPQDCG